MQRRNGSGETRELPLWRSAIRELTQSGMVQHGGFISREWLCEWFGLGNDSKGYLSLKMVPIRNYLKQRGYVITEANMHGSGFRILRAEENHADSAKIRKRLTRQMTRNVACMLNTPLQSLSHTQLRSHEMELIRSGLIAGEMRRISRKRKLPSGDPATVIKQGLPE